MLRGTSSTIKSAIKMSQFLVIKFILKDLKDNIHPSLLSHQHSLCLIVYNLDMPIHQEGALDALKNISESHRIQRGWIRAIARPLFQMITGGRARLEAYEDDAIAAVAAHMFTPNADLQQMAELMPGREFTFDEQRVIGRAAIRLARNKDFVRELFNGDAGPMIKEEIASTRRVLGLDK